MEGADKSGPGQFQERDVRIWTCAPSSFLQPCLGFHRETCGNTSSSRKPHTIHGRPELAENAVRTVEREAVSGPQEHEDLSIQCCVELNAVFGVHYNHSLNAHKKISSQNNEVHELPLQIHRMACTASEHEMRRAVSRAIENAGSVSTLLCFLRFRACGKSSYFDIDAAVLHVH